MKKIICKILLLILASSAAMAQDAILLETVEVKSFKDPFANFPSLEKYTNDTIFISIDSLANNDTLLFGAQIRDCGEFGGHNEYIFIIKQNNIITAEFKSDGDVSDCPWYKPGLKSKNDTLDNNEKNVISINSNSRIILEEYINKLWKFDPNLAYSNAPQNYWIKLREKEYFRKDFAGDWQHYINFRNKLFKEIEN